MLLSLLLGKRYDGSNNSRKCRRRALLLVEGERGGGEALGALGLCGMV